MNKIYRFLIWVLFLINLLIICDITVVDAIEKNIIDISLFEKMDPSSSDLNVYFYDLGTCDNGESYIITIGDIQILVDAGTNIESEEHIIQNMEKFLENDPQKVWEYVIFTHPDADHIVNAPSVFELFLEKNEKNEYKYFLENIIDFDKIESLIPLVEDSKKYDSYVNSREKILSMKQARNHYSARELTENNTTYSFTISNNTFLTILYNYYYDNYCTKKNNISVCFMITKGNQKLLFTGDLEQDGENYLIANNKSIELPNSEVVDLTNVTFFKAGHHGSSTSNTESFIDYIRPAYVAISCSADTTQFSFQNVQRRFPSQETMTNLGKYTDHIYITNKEVRDDNGNRKYEPYYGNILFIFDEKSVKVYSTNNCNEDNIAKVISDTEWFIQNRYDSIYIYTFDEPLNSYSSCTLIKYGHYEILIDCGSSNNDSRYFVEEVKKYCVDGVIEYVILTHGHINAFNKMVSPKGYGIIDNFKIKTVIDFRAQTTSDLAKSISFYPYKNYIDYLKKNEDEVLVISANDYLIETIIKDKLSFEIIPPVFSNSHTDDSYSLTTIIKYYKEKFIFVGDTFDFSNLVKNYGKNIANAKFYKASNSYDFIDNYNQFLEIISGGKLFTVIGTPLGYSERAIFGKKKSYCDILISNLKKKSVPSLIYPTSYIDSKGNHVSINGTIVFKSIYYNNIHNNDELKGMTNTVLLEDSFYYKNLA